MSDKTNTSGGSRKLPSVHSRLILSAEAEVALMRPVNKYMEDLDIEWDVAVGLLVEVLHKFTLDNEVLSEKASPLYDIFNEVLDKQGLTYGESLSLVNKFLSREIDSIIKWERKKPKK
jgi:hypothetical protein